MKFEFITVHRFNYPLPLLCRVLEVSVSGYYAWRKRPVSQRNQANQALVAQIKAVHRASYETYGSPRVQAELVAQGYGCGRHRVARLMRLHGIQAKQCRRGRITTRRQDGDPVAPNLLDRQFQAIAPNRKWLADITHIPTQEGDLYLATVLDLYARKIVGWTLDTSLKSELVERALQMAFRQRRPAASLLHHSDRGSQYTSQAYQQLLKSHRCQVSMSRVGNCYDNAPMESFFGTLKSELVHQRQYRSRAEAKRDIFVYIEGFYNRRRRHSALGYHSPEQFENSYYLSLNSASTKSGKPQNLAPNGARFFGQLNFHHVASLGAFGALFQREFNPVALFEVAKTVRFNRRIMHKDIRPILTSDEAVAFGGVEPLDGAADALAH